MPLVVPTKRADPPLPWPGPKGLLGQQISHLVWRANRGSKALKALHEPDSSQGRTVFYYLVVEQEDDSGFMTLTRYIVLDDGNSRFICAGEVNNKTFPLTRHDELADMKLGSCVKMHVQDHSHRCLSSQFDRQRR